jgi:hypothetical protein
VPSLAALPSSSFTLAAVYSRSSKSAQSLADVASEQLSLGSGGLTLYADDIAGKGLDELLASDTPSSSRCRSLSSPTSSDGSGRLGSTACPRSPSARTSPRPRRLSKSTTTRTSPRASSGALPRSVASPRHLLSLARSDTYDRPYSTRTLSASRRTAGRATSFARASSVR